MKIRNLAVPGIAVCLALLLSFLIPVTARAATYPCLFYGSASIDGEPVAAGTVITAWVGDEQAGCAVTGDSDQEDDRFVLPVEMEEAATVSFRIGDFTAAETALWEQYGSIEIDLTASSAGAAVTANYPCLFYGCAMVNNVPVEAGTVITAWIGGSQVGSTQTGLTGMDANQYSMVIEADCSAEVCFRIGSLNAAEKATWVQYGAVGQNLSATSSSTTPTQGGGYAAPATTTQEKETKLFGASKNLKIDSTGEVQETLEATSSDGKLKITIPKGVKALDRDNNPIADLTADVDADPPAPPEGGSVIGLVYDFGPSGATFDPPIILTFTYDPGSVPLGTDPVVMEWNEATGTWTEIEEYTIDPATNTIMASIRGFCKYSVIAKAIPVVEDVPVTTIPTDEGQGEVDEATTVQEDEPAVSEPDTTPATAEPDTVKDTGEPALQQDEDLAKKTNWGLIGGIAGGAVVVILILSYFLWVRRRYI